MKQQPLWPGFSGFRPLTRVFDRALWHATALAWCGVFAAGVCAAGVRLLPWLLSPDVPREVALQFARVLVGVAGEAAYVVGLPLGAALASALLHERGEARALFALGVSPRQIALGSWPTVLLLVVSFGAVSWGVGRGPDAPGAFANRLLEAGRTSCSNARTQRSATVPLLDVSWLCFPGQAPLLVGSVPGARQRVWFTANGASANTDMTQVTLRGAELAFRSDEGKRVARVSAAEARVTGLAWPHGIDRGSSRRSPRALSVLLTGICAALTVMGLTLRFAASRLSATALAVVGSAAPLAALHALERTGVTAAVVFVPALIAVSAPLIGLGAAHAWGRIHPGNRRT